MRAKTVAACGLKRSKLLQPISFKSDRLLDYRHNLKRKDERRIRADRLMIRLPHVTHAARALRKH